MVLTSTDLITISNYAKYIKHKEFLVFNGKLYGIDYINYYYIYTNDLSDYLNPEIMSEALIFATRELASFIKTITTETEFTLHQCDNSTYFIINDMGDKLYIKSNKFMAIDLSNRINNTIQYNFTDEVDISDDMVQLINMKKDDGVYNYRYNDIYYMTLFKGIFPLNKSDKILLSIYDNNGPTYMAKFTIYKKKNSKVNVIMSFLKV